MEKEFIFRVFDSEDNNMFILSAYGENVTEAIDSCINNDWIDEIVAVKHTHSNVLEFEYADGHTSYRVFTPVWSETEKEKYTSYKSRWCRA